MQSKPLAVPKKFDSLFLKIHRKVTGMLHEGLFVSAEKKRAFIFNPTFKPIGLLLLRPLAGAKYCIQFVCKSVTLQCNM